MMGRKWWFLALTLSLLVETTLVHARTDDWLSRFYAWSCKTTGYGCPRNASNLERNRGGNPASRPKGGALMAYDITSRTSRVLWADCGCWSPVPWNASELAVLTEGGIVVVPVENPQQRKPLLPGDDIRELLGVEFFKDRSMVMLRSARPGGNPGCELEPVRLRREDLREEPFPREAELACGPRVDFLDLIKPAQVAGERELMTLQSRGQYKITLESGGEVNPVLEGSGTTQRFDPVWIGKNVIAFIEKP